MTRIKSELKPSRRVRTNTASEPVSSAEVETVTSIPA
jgi:hypothetical protein